MTCVRGKGLLNAIVVDSSRPTLLIICIKKSFPPSVVCKILGISLSPPGRYILGPEGLLPPPKKEVMFLVRSVCLSVRRITRKLVNRF